MPRQQARINPSYNYGSTFDLVTQFLGYRNKEDKTNLPPGYLVDGSKNVRNTTGGRISVREGYTLDGQSSSTLAGITASYDWLMHNGEERNLRAGNGTLEVRYVATAGDKYLTNTFTEGQVYWIPIMSSLSTATNFNFAEYWNATEVKDRLLMVNGTAYIHEWSGGLTSIASVTSNTITKSGTTSWAEEGFNTAGTREISIDGTTYTYTGGESTTALTGVTPNPIIATTDQSQTTQDGSVTVGEQDVTTKHNKLAQSFIAGKTSISGVKLFKIANTGTFTGTVTVSLLSDVGGNPSNTLATVTIANATYNALPAAEFTATFATPYNSAVIGTKYWIYIETSTSDTSNHPNLGTNTVGGYTSGSVKYYATADGWTAIATIDLYFKTLYSVLAGNVAFQKIISTANGAMTSLGLLHNDLIGVLNNQVYVGDFKNRDVYVSHVDDYKDYGYTTPTRVTGEGMILTLDSCPVGFIPQEQNMYITSGLNDWYQTKFTVASDLSGETLTVDKLKTGSQQAAKSQAMISKMKNSVVFISNEPTMDELGRVQQILGTPQQTNMSDSIKNLFDTYDFTDGQVFYHKYFIYVSVPQEGFVLMYNIAKSFWEAPQQLPVGKFSIIGGELYGHDYFVPQTYKLFSGYNDNNHAIEAIAKFSFQNYGSRAKTKYFDEYYFEGYIDKNTTLTAGIQYETDGNATSTSFNIVGTDTRIVALAAVNSSLGKESFGKNPLGGDLIQQNPFDLPPKFRVIKTFPRNDFYEVQYSFSSLGIDYRWEILAYGAKAEPSMFGSNEIKQ